MVDPSSTKVEWIRTVIQCFPRALLESQPIFQTVCEIRTIDALANDIWRLSLFYTCGPSFSFRFLCVSETPLASVQQQHNDRKGIKECMYNHISNGYSFPSYVIRNSHYFLKTRSLGKIGEN